MLDLRQATAPADQATGNASPQATAPAAPPKKTPPGPSPSDVALAETETSSSSLLQTLPQPKPYSSNKTAPGLYRRQKIAYFYAGTIRSMYSHYGFKPAASHRPSGRS